LDDAARRQGAPNVDAACTGTVMRDFLRAADLSRVQNEIVALYDDSTGDNGELIYSPKTADAISQGS
jgi:hypothetical protein